MDDYGFKCKCSKCTEDKNIHSKTDNVDQFRSVNEDELFGEDEEDELFGEKDDSIEENEKTNENNSDDDASGILSLVQLEKDLNKDFSFSM